MFCLYIPPNLNSATFLSVKDYIVNCFDHVLNAYPEATLYLCGDFNRYDMSFLFNLFNLCNIVSCPTFGNSTLDKFFCAQHTASDYSAVTAPPLGNALHAHQIVFISRCGDTAIVRSSLRKVYDLRASHVLAYRERILATDWSTLFQD